MASTQTHNLRTPSAHAGRESRSFRIGALPTRFDGEPVIIKYFCSTAALLCLACTGGSESSANAEPTGEESAPPGQEMHIAATPSTPAAVSTPQTQTPSEPISTPSASIPPGEASAAPTVPAVATMTEGPSGSAP